MLEHLYGDKITYAFFKWSQLGENYFFVYLFQILYLFRATMCPSLGELTVSMRHWYFSLCMNEKYQCRTDTVSSPDDGHIVARNMYRSWKKYILSSSVHQAGFICKRLYMAAQSTKQKIMYAPFSQAGQELTQKTILCVVPVYFW